MNPRLLVAGLGNAPQILGVGAGDMRSQASLVSHVRGVLVATGGGLLAGYLIGVGAMGSYTHARWPALAGLVLGMISSLAAPSRQVLVAFCGGSFAVVTAVTKIVLIQFQRGRWPITDEVTIAQYDTAMQATMRAAVIFGVLIGIPCLIAAVLVAVAKRYCTHTNGPQQAAALGSGTAGAEPGQ